MQLAYHDGSDDTNVSVWLQLEVPLSDLWNSRSNLILGLLNQNVTDDPIFTESNSLVGRDHIQSTQDLIAPTSLQSFRGHMNDLFRLFRTWSPEFIPFAMPDIGYCVIGPAAITLRLARSLGTTSNSKQVSSPTVEEDILNLVLKRLAKYWEIGDVILGTYLATPVLFELIVQIPRGFWERLYDSCIDDKLLRAASIFNLLDLSRHIVQF